MKRKKYDLTLEEIRTALDYDPETGIFKHSTSNSVRPQYRGKVAGTVQYDGYRCIRVKTHRYYAHILAWFYTWGVWPSSQLDHRDTNRDNNAIDNLREATPIQNSVNCKRSKRNKSGFKGVCAYKGRWLAQASHKMKKIYLGMHDTPEEAYEAYKKYVESQHGEFARPDG